MHTHIALYYVLFFFLHSIGATPTSEGTPSGTFRDPVLIRDVACFGNEETIFDCAFSVTTTRFCTHARDVFLTCLPYGTYTTNVSYRLLHATYTTSFTLFLTQIASQVMYGLLMDQVILRDGLRCVWVERGELSVMISGT